MQVYTPLSSNTLLKLKSSRTVLAVTLVRVRIKRESVAKSVPSLCLIMAIAASWEATVPVLAEHDKTKLPPQVPLSGAKLTIAGVTSDRR